MNKIKVLLIAEMANPEWTSVPLVGWSLAYALREVSDIHLVTHVRNQCAIERAGFKQDIDFTVIDSEAVDAPLYRLATWLRGDSGKAWTTNTAMQSIRNYYFEYLVWRQFKHRIQNGEYQIVHQVTPLSPTTPSLMAAHVRKAGAHYIWGPINGGLPWPTCFNSVRRNEREWLSKVRDVYKLLPGYRGIRENASALVVASANTLTQMPSCYHKKCIYIPENGIDQRRFNVFYGHDYSKPLRVAFVGRLVPYKGGDMLLEAISPLVRQGLLTVEFFGAGPERDRLGSLAQSENISSLVTFHGNVEHRLLQEKLGACDLLALPSIREFGGGVVLEAMALGVVPIVVGYGGPNELVSAETGYRIPMGTRLSIIHDLHALFMQLCDDSSPLIEMSSRSRDRVHSHFTWDMKARQMLEVYRWVLADKQGVKPDFKFNDLIKIN